jgi:chromosome segregation ATPase
MVDIEVTAGETSARLAASELRSRWEREGASTLRDLEVETVEDLDALCRHAEATLRAADDKRRDAEQADLQAARQALDGDTTALTARVTELEAELGGADVASLVAAFARLGEAWQATLKQRTADAERSRQVRVPQLDRHRAELTRLETQLEALSANAGRLADEASRRQADLGDTWSMLVARHRADLAEADRVIADVERQLQAMSGAATDEELVARTEVARAESGVAATSQRRDGLQIEAQQARDAAIEASTTLASVRARARELDAGRVWESALHSSSALGLSAWTSALATAEAQRDALKLEKNDLRQQLEQLVAERNAAILGARAAVEAAEAHARVTRTRCDELQRDLRAIADQRSQIQAALAEMRVRTASTNHDAILQTIASLRGEIAALEGSLGNFDAGDLERRRQTVHRLTGQLREADDDLARARGALEQVGGAIVREHQRDLAQALQQALDREHELEVEFDAWKLLLDTLRASEAGESAHLGRALAGPISGRFRQLTGGRYGHLELGAHLQATGLEAAGTLRDIGALSAGTQDQLATLLRLCVAEHLHSTIVLDDHLSHSDPARVAWFNTILRTSAQQIQIVFITCRPTEVLSTSEFPPPGEPAVSGAGGLVRAIDLSTLIKRFAPTTSATPGKVGATAPAPPA